MGDSTFGIFTNPDSTGTVVGIVGVDMNSSVVTAKLDAINMILYLIGIIAMISVALGLIVVERRRSIDEQKLEESEKKYRSFLNRLVIPS